MPFDYEDKKPKGEKNWAKEREGPAEAEAAEGDGCIWALFGSRCGGSSVGRGPGARPGGGRAEWACQ